MNLAYTYYDIGVTFIVSAIIGSLIGCTVMGLVVRYIMKGKGYQNLGTWFCCGFFLGVIGLIIAITRPDLRLPPYPNANPYGQPMNPNQQYGQPYPNQQFPNQQYPNQQYGQPYQNGQYNPQFNQQFAQQPQGVRCQSCGMMNTTGSTFCAGCGNKMN
ncbi:MAG: hypothetical protein J5956_14255 [Ruminococcus sp.]|nr:hypothetical protein [Ruminococcus sp.]